MLRFWKKIKRFLFGPKTELEFVRRSLKRNKDLLSDIEERFDPAYDCCQDCMTAGYYSKLIDKIERMEKHIKGLERREERKLQMKKKQKPRQNSIYCINFPSKESAIQYEKEMEKLGFHSMTIGPTINMNELKKRRFNNE